MSRIFDKAGVLGTFVAAMGCASCFPVLGSIGAALGMGFLAQYEGAFVNTLLPVFAAIALIANCVSFISHKICYRALIAIAGPIMVLLTMYPLWVYNWSTYLLYVGIVMMMLVALWDIISPPVKACANKEA